MAPTSVENLPAKTLLWLRSSPCIPIYHKRPAMNRKHRTDCFYAPRALVATFSGYCSRYLTASPKKIIVPASISYSHSVIMFSWMVSYCVDKSAFPQVRSTTQELTKLREAALILDIPALVVEIEDRLVNLSQADTYMIPIDAPTNLGEQPDWMKPVPRTEDISTHSAEQAPTSTLDLGSLDLRFDEMDAD